MVRTLLSFLLAAVLIAPISHSDRKQLNFQRVWMSVTGIQAEDNICTAFAVRVFQYVTANHCLELMTTQITTTSGVNARTIKRDAKHDIALLEIHEVKPALILGDEPKIGDNVFQMGYGAASARRVERAGQFPYIFPAIVLDLHDHPFQDDNHSMTFAGTTISGMSGGPIIDQEGNVVSVVQGGGMTGTPLQQISYGVEYSALKNLIK